MNDLDKKLREIHETFQSDTGSIPYAHVMEALRMAAAAGDEGRVEIYDRGRAHGRIEGATHEREAIASLVGSMTPARTFQDVAASIRARGSK